jgi:peptide/nickel transport system substrate-binding protein
MISKRVAGVFLILATLCACTRVGVTTKSGRNPWTIPGVLRIGSTEEPNSLNLMFGYNLATDEVSCLLYSFILRNDANGNLFPDLATEVPSLKNGGISKDGKTITVHLRHGVKWSDGYPLTAKDWLFTYHAVMNPQNNIKTNYGWDMIQSASAPDPYTIVIHLKQPTVQGLEILTMGGAAYPPLPAHILAKYPNINNVPFNSHPISSGPYILQEWRHGDRLVFIPNPFYFRGKPKLREIIWHVIPDPNSILSELATHQIDVYAAVNLDEVAQLSTISGIRIEHRLVAWWQHLGINTAKPELSDPRVRQAIAEGVDWKRIVETVYHGYAQLAVSDIFPQETWVAPKLPPYRFDPADAKRLLAQAGWKMGGDGVLHKGPLSMDLMMVAGADDNENEESEVLIQSMLKPLGIRIGVKNYPRNYLFAADGPIYGGKYDLEWSLETNGPDPDDSGSFDSKFIPPHGANTSRLNDPLVNKLTEEAASTFDPAVRKRLYQQEEARLRQLNPVIFAFWWEEYYGINTDVKNYVPSAFIADEWNAWEWDI